MIAFQLQHIRNEYVLRRTISSYFFSDVEERRVSLADLIHRDSAMMTGLRAVPRAVSLYSTVGGIVMY